jgi:putative transposase
LQAQRPQNEVESRRGWMLWLFKSAGIKNPNNVNFQFWQQENHPEEIFTKEFLESKMNYVHFNPVEAGLVENPEDYLLSSARDYLTNKKGLIEIDFI